MKQQLRECQADVSHKLNEIIGLRAVLKEKTAKMEILEKQNKNHEDSLHSRTIDIEVSLLIAVYATAEMRHGHVHKMLTQCSYDNSLEGSLQSCAIFDCRMLSKVFSISMF